MFSHLDVIDLCPSFDAMCTDYILAQRLPSLQILERGISLEMLQRESMKSIPLTLACLSDVYFRRIASQQFQDFKQNLL